MTSVFFIAEAGVNHNGDITLAHRLIDVAADCGADAIKFQTFRADALVTTNAAKAAYQQTAFGAQAGESQFDMLRALELSPDDHAALMHHAKDRGLAFLSTPFDEQSLRFLTTDLGMQTIKIPSGEITNLPFIDAAARVANHIIVSTGASTLAEIDAALTTLATGFMGGSPSFDPQPFATLSDDAKRAVQDRVTVLQCTTAYPAPNDTLNLSALRTIADAFSVPVGFSDHSVGIAAGVAAVGIGASVIEKHFTLDRTMPGPDHAASLEPDTLKTMIAMVREASAAMGDGIKRPCAAEQANIPVIRRSLVAARAITKGEVWQADMMVAKRPAGGLPPSALWQLVGTQAARDFAKDEIITQ